MLSQSVPEHFPAQVPVALIGLPDGPGQGPLLHRHVPHPGEEGGVAAVVGPVRVQQPQFRLGGVPALLVPEIGLGVLQVRQGHGQAQVLAQAPQLVPGGGPEPVQGLDLFRFRQGRVQGFGLGLGRLPAVHRVHQVGADLLQFIGSEGAPEHVHPGPGHRGPDAVGEQLQALGGAVRALVVLPGQVFHRQGRLPGREGQNLVVHQVHRRFGEHRPAGPGQLVVPEPLHVVAHHQPHPFQAADAQVLAQVMEQLAGLHGERRLFLHEQAADGGHGGSLKIEGPLECGLICRPV